MVWLDLVRGLSALAVCAGHLRFAMFVHYGRLMGSALVAKLFYALTSFARQSVMVFFVLSGFFVGGSVIEQGANFRWSSYLQRRFTRLWVVIVPALLWTFAVDFVTSHVAPQVLSGAYSSRWHLAPAPGSYTESPLTLISNLFFLQTIATPVFGSNEPMWSLANEACYYVIFPLLIFAAGFGARGSWLWRIAAGALAGVLLTLVSAMGFLIWSFGVLVAYLGTHVLRRPNVWLSIVGCAALVAALAYSKVSHIQTDLGVGGPLDVIVGLGAALFALGMLRTPFLGGRDSALARGSVNLSEISYSLYLFHYPLVLLIGGAVFHGSQRAPTAKNMIEFVGWMALIVAGATVFWWLFERRTDRVRAWFATRVKSQSAGQLERVP